MTSPAARLCLLALFAAATFVLAFSPHAPPRPSLGRRAPVGSALFVEPDPDTLDDMVTASKRNKPGLDGDLRTKLITKTIAPWRTLRLFL